MSDDAISEHTWAYRMVRDPETGTVEVCEVYTRTSDGRHPGWTGPIHLHGDSRDDVCEQFLRLARAIVEPILTPDEDGKFLVEEPDS